MAFENIIDSICFKIGNEKYKAKPIDMLFSREIPNSDFTYPIFKWQSIICSRKYEHGDRKT